MFDIKKVFFNNTVHWAGLGPITEITGEQFRDAMWVENMPGFAFEHMSGEITWVPASNIRWVQAVITEAESQTASRLSTVDDYEVTATRNPDLPEDEAPPARKRGRPKRGDVH